MDFLKMLFGAANVPGINAKDANELLKGAQPPFILDVRQPDEFKQGHIPGAKLIPLGELKSRLEELPQERDILCVCHSGSRSGMAAMQLHSAGFKVINLRGGMIGWMQSGLALKKGQ